MIQPDKTRFIITIAAIIVLLGSGVFIGRCTRSTTDTKYFDQLMAAKDSINALHEHERGVYQDEINTLQSNFDILSQKDSLLTQHFINDQKVYKTLDEKLKAIPIRISHISSNTDSLRQLFADF